MSKVVYLLVGCPGSGKSWVTDQLRGTFTVVEHDDYMDRSNEYPDAVVAAAWTSLSPVIANTPFGVSKLQETLEQNALKVIPVFIIEPDAVVTERYEAREGRPISKGHLTRQRTYFERALELGAFHGGSQEVLDYLSSQVSLEKQATG